MKTDHATYLGAEDAAWLHMDEPTNPMVVNALLSLEEHLPIERARALLARIADEPRFRARVVEPWLGVGRPTFEPASDFDFTRHIEHIELDAEDDEAVRRFVGEVASAPLDLAAPLWRVYVLDRPGAPTAILFRVHHALADGFALLALLGSLCGGAEGTHVAPSTHPTHAVTARESARALRRLVALPADRKTLLKRPLGTEKRVAWSAPLSLEAVKSAAHALSATVNDVLVATVAGALGRYLARRHEPICNLELHAMVPVNLRADDAAEALGNRFGLVVLGLPVGMADPCARVRAVQRRMTELKGTHEAGVTFGLLRAMGPLPRAVEELGVSFFGEKASLVLTNVPGPRTQVRIAGIAVRRMMFWVPQSGRMGLGISILSYAGEVTIGAVSDAIVVPDPDALVADVQLELAALEAEVAAALPGLRGG